MDVDAIRVKNALIDWLLDIDDHETLPDGISALNFGLYQGGFDGKVNFKQVFAEQPYEIELTGSVHYDADDDNWVCDEDFVPLVRSCPHLSIDEAVDRDAVFNVIAQALVEITDELDSLSIIDVPYITLGFTDEPLSIIRSDAQRVRRQPQAKPTPMAAPAGNPIEKQYENATTYDIPAPDEMAAFIGKKIAFYKSKWNKHEYGYLKGWNWVPFFFPVEWLFYRKLYAEAFVILILNLVVFWFISIPVNVTNLIVAFMGNALYYKKYIRTSRKTDDMTQDDRIEYLRQKGGVSVLSVILCVIVQLVIEFAILNHN